MSSEFWFGTKELELFPPCTAVDFENKLCTVFILTSNGTVSALKATGFVEEIFPILASPTLSPEFEFGILFTTFTLFMFLGSTLAFKFGVACRDPSLGSVRLPTEVGIFPVELELAVDSGGLVETADFVSERIR